MSFLSPWPSLLERLELLSQAVVLIGHSVSSNSLNATDKLISLETELDLIHDKLGTDQKLTDVPLHSAWEGIRLINSGRCV